MGEFVNVQDLFDMRSLKRFELFHVCYGDDCAFYARIDEAGFHIDIQRVDITGVDKSYIVCSTHGVNSIPELEVVVNYNYNSGIGIDYLKRNGIGIKKV